LGLDEIGWYSGAYITLVAMLLPPLMGEKVGMGVATTQDALTGIIPTLTLPYQKGMEFSQPRTYISIFRRRCN